MRARSSRRMTRRALTTDALGAVAAGSMAAALGAACDGALPWPGGGRGVTVTGPARVHFMFFGGPDQVDVAERINRGFAAAHPKIRVEPIHVPNYAEYYDKVYTLAAAGERVDVIMAAGPFLVALAAKGLYLSLNDLMRRDRFPVRGYIPSALQSLEWRGKQYALPELINFGITFYNKQAFDRQGLRYPDADWTREQHVDLARRLTVRQGEETRQWGTWPLLDHIVHLHGWLWSHGGRVFDDEEEPKRSTWNTPRVVEALEYRANWALAHGAAPRTGEVQGDPFVTGQVAMRLGGTFQILHMTRQVKDFTWDVTLQPRASAGRIQGLGAQIDGIAGWSQQADAAWLFVRHRTGEPGVKVINQEQYGVPSLVKVAEEDFVNLPAPPSQVARQTLVKGLKELRPMPKAEHTSELWNRVYTPQLNQQLFTGKAGAQEVAQNIDRLTNEIISR